MTTKLILVYILLAVVLTLGLGGYTINANLNRIQQESIRSLTRSADDIMGKVDPRLKSMDQMAVDVFSSAAYRTFGADFLETGDPEARISLQKTINNLYSMQPDIRRAALYNLDGGFCVTGATDVTEEAASDRAHGLLETYETVFERENAKVFLSPRTDFWAPGQQQPLVITEIRAIHSRETGEIIGFLEIQQNAMYIDEICSVELYGTPLEMAILMEDTNAVFFSKNEREDDGIDGPQLLELTRPGGKIIETDEAILARSQSNNFYCHTVVILSRSDLWDYQFSVISGSILIVLITVVLSVVFGVLLTRTVMRPVDQFVQKLQNVDLCNLDQKIDVVAHSREVSVLVDAFNQLAYRLRSSLQRQKQHEDYQTKALFQALQKEMGPHFLYNSLGSIADLCECGESEKAARACFDLTDLLRYASNYDMPDVTLEEDLENAKCFMSLMQNRYRQRLTFDYEVDDSALPALMPRMTLQPLLENAIKYSIREQDVVHIRLAILYVSGLLIVMVKDNGLTIPEERKAYIEQKVEAFCRSPGETPEDHGVRFGGIGLIGTLTRLRIYYGQSFQYEILGNADGGTTILLYMDRV